MSRVLQVLQKSESERILHGEHVMYASSISQDMTMLYTGSSYLLKHAHCIPLTAQSISPAPSLMYPMHVDIAQYPAELMQGLCLPGTARWLRPGGVWEYGTSAKALTCTPERGLSTCGDAP